MEPVQRCAPRSAEEQALESPFPAVTVFFFRALFVRGARCQRLARAGRYIDTVLVTYCIPNSELKYNLSFRVVAAPVQHCELQVRT